MNKLLFYLIATVFILATIKGAVAFEDNETELLHIKFDDNFTDVSVNNWTVNSFAAPNYVDMLNSRAIDIDLAAERLQVTHDAMMSMQGLSYTICMWQAWTGLGGGSFLNAVTKDTGGAAWRTGEDDGGRLFATSGGGSATSDAFLAAPMGATHVCYQKNTTHFNFYVNATLSGQTADANLPGANPNDITIACSATGAGCSNSDIHISDLRIYNWSLNEANISLLNNSGVITHQTLRELQGGPAPSPAANDSFNFKVFNTYGNTLIDNFSVTVSNSTFRTTFNTTTGSISEDFGNGSYFVNFTNIANNTFFNVTGLNFTVSGASSPANVSAFQTYITFNATQLFTTIFINGLNVTTELQSNHSALDSPSALLLLNATNITIHANATGHFNITTSVNLSPLDNLTITLVFFDALYNVTLRNKNSNVTEVDWTLNVTPTTLLSSTVYVTSTSNITGVQLIKGLTYDFLGSKTNFDVSNRTFIIDDAFGNLTLFGQAVHSFNLEVFSEVSHRRFSTTAEENDTVNIELIGPTVRNLTTNNGTLFVANLSPGNYEIRYFADSFDRRSFFIILPTLGSGKIDLFLLNSTVSTQIVVEILDENEDPLEGAILKVQRFYPSLNAFETVEMGQANFNGEIPINIVFNTQEYRFLIERSLGGDVIFLSSEFKITSTELKIRVQTGISLLRFVQGFDNIGTSLTSVTTPNNTTYTYVFSDNTNFVTVGCLEVTLLKGDGTDQLCLVCSESTSATLICQVNRTTGMITATGFINTTGSLNFTVVTDTISEFLDDAFLTFGSFALFPAMLLMIAIPAVGIYNVHVSMILGVFSLVVTYALGLYVVGIGTLLGLLFSAAIIIFKGGKG